MSSNFVKIGFVTCVQIGLSCMEEIYAACGKLDLAITLKDDLAKKKSGRIYLDKFCNKQNIPLLKIQHINDKEVINAIELNQLDWLFIIGWSQIASKSVINAPKKGVLGMHPTILPKGRGRASIPWAILKKLPKTGVTLFKLDSGVDTGPIVDCVEIPLSNSITATELYEQVDKAHTHLIQKVMPKILANNLTLIKQSEDEASEWPGRKPEDGEIDLNGSVYDAECLVRAVTRPYPGAYIKENNLQVIVWEAKIVNKPSKNRCLQFFDGFLECLDYEVEAL